MDTYDIELVEELIYDSDKIEEGEPEKDILYKDRSNEKFYMFDRCEKCLGMTRDIYVFKDMSINKPVACLPNHFKNNFIKVSAKDV